MCVYDLAAYSVLMRLFVGAIFDESSEEEQKAFKYAVTRENMYESRFEFVPQIKTIQSADGYAAEKAGKYFFCVRAHTCLHLQIDLVDSPFDLCSLFIDIRGKWSGGNFRTKYIENIGHCGGHL